MHHRIALVIAIALMAMLVHECADAKGAAGGAAGRVTKVKVSPAPSAHDPFGADDTSTSARGRRAARSPSSSSAGRQRREDAKSSRYLLAQQARVQAREKEDVAARADRLYSASQVSAPIIVDAKACRRTGANGESVYENCETAAAKPPSR